MAQNEKDLEKQRKINYVLGITVQLSEDIERAELEFMVVNECINIYIAYINSENPSDLYNVKKALYKILAIDRDNPEIKKLLAEVEAKIRKYEKEKEEERRKKREALAKKKQEEADLKMRKQWKELTENTKKIGVTDKQIEELEKEYKFDDKSTDLERLLKNMEPKLKELGQQVIKEQEEAKLKAEEEEKIANQEQEDKRTEEEKNSIRKQWEVILKAAEDTKNTKSQIKALTEINKLYPEDKEIQEKLYTLKPELRKPEEELEKGLEENNKQTKFIIANETVNNAIRKYRDIIFSGGTKPDDAISMAEELYREHPKTDSLIFMAQVLYFTKHPLMAKKLLDSALKTADYSATVKLISARDYFEDRINSGNTIEKELHIQEWKEEKLVTNTTPREYKEIKKCEEQILNEKISGTDKITEAETVYTEYPSTFSARLVADAFYSAGNEDIAKEIIIAEDTRNVDNIEKKEEIKSIIKKENINKDLQVAKEEQIDNKSGISLFIEDNSEATDKKNTSIIETYKPIEECEQIIADDKISGEETIQKTEIVAVTYLPLIKLALMTKALRSAGNEVTAKIINPEYEHESREKKTTLNYTYSYEDSVETLGKEKEEF